MKLHLPQSSLTRHRTRRLRNKSSRSAAKNVSLIIVLVVASTVSYLFIPQQRAQANYKTYQTALLQGDELEDQSLNLNVTQDTLGWNLDQQLDGNYFSWTDANNSRLVVEQAGDYFVSLTIPITSLGGTAERNSVKGFIYVNGVKSDVGLGGSSYMRNQTDNDESSSHLTAFLSGLSVDDYIEVIIEREAIGTSNTVVSDVHSLYAEYVGDETLFSATGTEVTSGENLNVATPASFIWDTELRNDTGFTHSTSTAAQDITLDEAADYFVSISVPTNSPTTRVNVLGRVLLDGTEVPSGQFKQGFVRGIGEHTWSSTHFSGFVSSSSVDQVLSVTFEQEAGSGFVSTNGEKANIYIKKLPANDVYAATATTLEGASTNWNPSSVTDVSWDTDLRIDSSLYTHSTSTNNHEITLEEDGDYFLSINVPFSTSVPRGNPNVYVYLNGDPVPGLESKSGYVRASEGHNESSLSLTAMITRVQSGDVLTIGMVEEAGEGVVTITDEASLLVWKKSLNPVITQNAYRWYHDNFVITPNFPWDSENTPLTIVNDSTFYGTISTLRLRLGLMAGITDIGAGSDQFKLQYATSTSGPWTDVDNADEDSADWKFASLEVSVDDWYNTDWKYRKRLAIDNINIQSDLTDFPVLVSLSGDSALAAKAQADSDDILFTNAAGTKLAHEIEDYDPSTGDLTAWVKAPTVSASQKTDVYMYYGNDSATNQQDVTNVWTNGYAAVYHLSEDPSSTSDGLCSGGVYVACDSSGNGNHLQSAGMDADDKVAGRFGFAANFNASTEGLWAASDPSLENFTELTLSAWVDVNGDPGPNWGRILHKAQSTNTDDYGLIQKNGTGNPMNFRITTAGQANLEGSTPLTPESGWQVLHTVWNGSTMYIYHNSVQEGSLAKSGAIDDSNLKLGVGNHATDSSFNRYFNGAVDEARVQDVIRSPHWIEAEYANQNTPTEFYTVGSEEVPSNAGTLPSTLLTASDTAQNYVIGNPAPRVTSSVLPGDTGEWDFALSTSNALTNTIYYFRLASLTGSVMSYGVYPSVEIVIPSTDQQMRNGKFFNQESEQIYSF